MRKRSDVAVLDVFVGEPPQLLEDRARFVPSGRFAARDVNQRRELRIITGVSPAKNALATKRQHRVTLPTVLRFGRGALAVRPSERLNEAPKFFIVFAGDGRDRVDRLDVILVSNLLAADPVERVNVGANVIDVELFAEIFAVTAVNVRVDVVILDRGGPGPVFQLRVVGVHRQEVDIRDFAGRVGVPLRRRGEFVVSVGTGLVDDIMPAVIRPIAIFGGRSFRVLKAAVVDVNLDAASRRRLQEFLRRNARHRDQKVESAIGVSPHIFVVKVAGSEVPPSADSEPFAPEISGVEGRIDPNAEEAFDRLRDANRRLRPGRRRFERRFQAGNVDAEFRRAFAKRRLLRVGRRRVRAERGFLVDGEKAASDGESNRPLVRTPGDVGQRRGLLRNGQAIRPRRGRLERRKTEPRRRRKERGAFVFLSNSNDDKRFRARSGGDRFRRFLGVLQEVIGAIPTVGERSAGNFALLQRRVEGRRAGIIGRVVRFGEERFGRLFAREEAESGERNRRAGRTRVRRVESERRNDALPILMRVRPHVDDQIAPNAVANDRELREALVGKRRQFVGCEENPADFFIGLDLVPQREKGPLRRREPGVFVDRKRERRVGSANAHRRQTGFDAQFRLPDVRVGDVRAVVENPSGRFRRSLFDRRFVGKRRRKRRKGRNQRRNRERGPGERRPTKRTARFQIAFQRHFSRLLFLYFRLFRYSNRFNRVRRLFSAAIFNIVRRFNRFRVDFCGPRCEIAFFLYNERDERVYFTAKRSAIQAFFRSRTSNEKKSRLRDGAFVVRARFPPPSRKRFNAFINIY